MNLELLEVSPNGGGEIISQSPDRTSTTASFRRIRISCDSSGIAGPRIGTQETIFVPPYEEYVGEFNRVALELLALTPTVRSVKDLADDSFRVREAAQLKLWVLAELAVDALQDGVKSPDPERAHRSRLLLRRIGHWQSHCRIYKQRWCFLDSQILPGQA